MDFGQFSISLVMTSQILLTAGKNYNIITDQHVNAYLDGEFTLNCKLSLNNITVSMVEWKWSSPGKKEERIVVFNNQHGPFYHNSSFSWRVTFFNHSQHHVSIRVTDVKLNDAGEYTCHYTTFPKGALSATARVTVTETHLSSLTILGISMAALLVTVLLATFVYVTLKSAQKRNKTRSCSGQTTTDEDKNLNYAEIGFFRKAGGTNIPQSKTDTEYGEVVFSTQPSSAHSPSDQPKGGRDIVYSQVKRA